MWQICLSFSLSVSPGEGPVVVASVHAGTGDLTGWSRPQWKHCCPHSSTIRTPDLYTGMCCRKVTTAQFSVSCLWLVSWPVWLDRWMSFNQFSSALADSLLVPNVLQIGSSCWRKQRSMKHKAHDAKVYSKPKILVSELLFSTGRCYDQEDYISLSLLLLYHDKTLILNKNVLCIWSPFSYSGGWAFCTPGRWHTLLKERRMLSVLSASCWLARPTVKTLIKLMICSGKKMTAFSQQIQVDLWEHFTTQRQTY